MTHAAALLTNDDDADLQLVLDEKVQKAYGKDGAALAVCWERYRKAIQHAGNPPDQIQRFEQAGVILQPKQLEFSAWARLADQPDMPDEIGFGGAKSGGKSFGLFAQVAIDDCQRFAGLKVLFLREIGKHAQEQMEDLTQSVLGRVRGLSVVQGRVSYPNGSRIIVGHFATEKEAMSYAGIEYDIVVLEEATSLSFNAYKALRLSARSAKGFRPRVYNDTNPLGKGHLWYKRRFIDPERGRSVALGKTKFIFSTVDDNQFVNAEYVDVLNDLPPVMKQAFRWGNWDVQAGTFFTQWNEQTHVIPPLDSIPPDWEVWLSMDYGFGHWNIVLFHCKDNDGNLITFDELSHRGHYPHEIAADIFAKLEYYEISVERLMTLVAGGDLFNKTAHSDKTIDQQYRVLGLRWRRAQVQAGSRVAGAAFINQLLGNPDRNLPPHWQVTRNCRKLVETMGYLEHDPRNLEDVLKVDCDSNGIGGDDAYDAARYGLYKPKQGGVA